VALYFGVILTSVQRKLTRLMHDEFDVADNEPAC